MRVAKHPFHLGVGEHDLSKGLDDNDTEGADLDRNPQYVVYLRAHVACKSAKQGSAHAHILLRAAAADVNATPDAESRVGSCVSGKPVATGCAIPGDK